jgi:hypothetical protein
MREHFNPWICILYIYMYVSRFMTYITIYVHRTCDSVMCDHIIQSMWWWIDHIQGRIQDFKVGGALKKKCAERREARKFLGYFVWKITILRQKIIFFPIVEGGAKIYGVFRVKNHDFTPTNHILSNFRGAPPSPWICPCYWAFEVKWFRENRTPCWFMFQCVRHSIILVKTLTIQKGQFIRLFSNCLHYLFSSVTPLSIIFQLYPGSRYYLVEDTGVPRDNHRPAASYWLFRMWRRKNNRLWQLWQMVSPKVWKPFKYSFFFLR